MTKDTLFRPSRMETKAETTTAVAMGMIDKESAARDAKTQRLRAARLEREAAELRKTPPKKRTSAKK